MNVVAFAAAVAEWNPGGIAVQSRADYAARLAICEGCRWRSGLICSARDCGCRLESFALDRSSECPTGRWQAISVNGD
jgi:hypothetical protein